MIMVYWGEILASFWRKFPTGEFRARMILEISTLQLDLTSPGPDPAWALVESTSLSL